MAGQCVAPYRQRGQHDGNAAEAIGEAVGRPTRRFVPVQSAEPDAGLRVHRARARRRGNRTAQVTQIRGVVAAVGLGVAPGIEPRRGRVPAILEDAENGLPALAREILAERLEQLRSFDHRVAHDDRQIAQLAAWLGRVPKPPSGGGKFRLGAITKRGDADLRKLRLHGARRVLATGARRDDANSRWAKGLKERRGANVAAVALAATPARSIWALPATGEAYRAA
jgi:transposase